MVSAVQVSIDSRPRELETCLAVPPPPEQRAVRYPRVQVVLAEEGEVCADHVRLRVSALLI